MPDVARSESQDNNARIIVQAMQSPIDHENLSKIEIGYKRAKSPRAGLKR
jgi:hypothetical protein